jgi:hypothetical protein
VWFRGILALLANLKSTCPQFPKTIIPASAGFVVYSFADAAVARFLFLIFLTNAKQRVKSPAKKRAYEKYPSKFDHIE